MQRRRVFTLWKKWECSGKLLQRDAAVNQTVSPETGLRHLGSSSFTSWDLKYCCFPVRPLSWVCPAGQMHLRVLLWPPQLRRERDGAQEKKEDGASKKETWASAAFAMNSLCDSEEVTSHLWAVTSFLKWLWYLLKCQSCGPQHLVLEFLRVFSSITTESGEMWGKGGPTGEGTAEGKVVTHSQNVTCLEAAPHPFYRPLLAPSFSSSQPPHPGRERPSQQAGVTLLGRQRVWVVGGRRAWWALGVLPPPWFWEVQVPQARQVTLH